MWRFERCLLLRRRVRFKNSLGSERGPYWREVSVEEYRELCRRWFDGRMDRREGGGERLLVPVASCANLRRSKLLKYWCNTHVSLMDLQNKRSRQMSTVTTRVGSEVRERGVSGQRRANSGRAEVGNDGLSWRTVPNPGARIGVAPPIREMTGSPNLDCSKPHARNAHPLNGALGGRRQKM